MDNEAAIELKTSDKLAYQRTILAQERTLMASVRTSVSLISFGFTIAKFFHDLKEKGVLEGTGAATKRVGIWLIWIGTLYIFASCIQHQLVLKSLRVEGAKFRYSFTFILALIITILGAALIFSFYNDLLELGLTN